MDIIVKIPDIFKNDLNGHDIRMIIGVSLYEKEIMGSNEIAEAVGVPYDIFIREMGKYGESIFDSGLEDVSDNFKNAILKQ
jgi:hypothetical protein